MFQAGFCRRVGSGGRWKLLLVGRSAAVVGRGGGGFTLFTHRIGGLFVTAAHESYPDEQNCHLLEVDVSCIF